MSDRTASDLIMGHAGPPAAKFPTVGTLIRGQIIETAVAQQKDYMSGDLKYWRDGSPMMQAVITVQTDHRDPDVTDDDGQRRLFVGSRNMRDAVRDAVTTAGQKTLEVGGTIAIQYTGDGPLEQVGGNAPKLYAAEYKPPALDTSLLTDPGQPDPTQAPRSTSLLG